MRTATVNFRGVLLDCAFEFDGEESATNAHPGSPANATLDSCKVAGVEIIEMLTGEQIDRIEELLIETMEGAFA